MFTNGSAKLATQSARTGFTIPLLTLSYAAKLAGQESSAVTAVTKALTFPFSVPSQCRYVILCDLPCATGRLTSPSPTDIYWGTRRVANQAPG